MAYDTRVQQRRDRGFTLIELLVVVAIVAVMAATSLPAIGTYIRNYRIKGAAQVVAGVMQSARSKAIMGNANNGVSFVTVDADSYRWVDEDKLAGEQLGPLGDLPIGIRFVAVGAAGAGPSLRFNRLGGFCNPAAGAPCTAAVTMAVACTEGVARCGREPGGLFVGTEGSGMIITLLEENTGLLRTVRIAAGGRVLAQP